MCGRVDIHTPPSELARLLEAAMTLGIDPDGRPSWNVPPSRGVPVIVGDAEPDRSAAPGENEAVRAKLGSAISGQKCAASSEELKRRLDIYRWGLLPHWAKDTRVGYKMINAKAETLTKSPAYRVPFRQHRCLIVVDGFFEWKVDPANPKRKIPYYFKRADGQPITFAGLYDTWWDKSRSKEPDPETLLRTCTIITTAAGPDMVDVHNRMPVIVERGSIDAWLDPRESETDALSAYLAPAKASTLVKYSISRTVNSPRNDGPEIIGPLTEPEE